MKIADGNRIALLETGDRYFPVLEAACREAREEIHVETYLFENDATGHRIAHALAEAARRGVVVRVLADGFGTRNVAPALRAVLIAGGVHLRVYRPAMRGFPLRLQHLRRLHRKLVVVDGRVGFCGGINLVDDRDAGGDVPRYDFTVRVEGPLVGDLHRAVRRLWLLTGLTARPRTTDPRMRWRARPAPIPGGHPASFVTRDNLRHRRAIEDAYLRAIAAARHDVLIACAYFLPGRRIRHALTEAVRRGVRVRLLLQGRPDHLLVHHATHGLYGTFQRAGIEVYEYQPAHLHAKVACVDDTWATVGSSNIDPFSLWLSREANVILHDRRLVAELRTSLEHAIANAALPITPDLARPLGFLTRLRAALFYQLARGVVQFAGFAAREEL
ncbi:MAG: cardiolipin synthase ClsB [Gammaproteobacteria bacterium]